MSVSVPAVLAIAPVAPAAPPPVAGSAFQGVEFPAASGVAGRIGRSTVDARSVSQPPGAGVVGAGGSAAGGSNVVGVDWGSQPATAGRPWWDCGVASGASGAELGLPVGRPGPATPDPESTPWCSASRCPDWGNQPPEDVAVGWVAGAP
ncbi:hypothetical protein [Polymorphospora rubra]|uniref:Uncharacterized protein n=1 Tax=Polymorphospora rubra TaxID=338584 RepID=A0A810MVG5_9ACTN|nr:hypothetical protein Prubr_21780 [Polymorphospora rubra]